MVDFVLVSALVTLLFLAVIQLALVLHVRNTVADAASSAARYGALADRTAADAKSRAELLLGESLGSNYARGVSASVVTVGGVRVMTVRVIAPMPLIGLLGPTGSMELSGHAALPG